MTMVALAAATVVTWIVYRLIRKMIVWTLLLTAVSVITVTIFWLW